MRVLVVEDEPRVAAAIARGLRRHGAAVDVSGDGEGALFHARVYSYDVVVLDRDLPGIHGDDVCRLHDELTRSTQHDELVKHKEEEVMQV